VLGENAVFKDCDLRAFSLLTHDHDAVDALAARKELGLREDWRSATTSFTAFASTLLLRL